MEPAVFYEILGYVASVLVAVSLTMRSVLRLRLVNLVGALVFTAYGVFIRAWPVAGVNFFITGVNVYFLIEMFGRREYLQLFPVRPEEGYLRRFLDFHQVDIARLVPGFDRATSDHDVALFILRDMVPAGVFLARKEDGGELRVNLDYVTPNFRDLKSARFLYGEKLHWFTERGYRRVVTPPGSSAHRSYLHRMDFVPRPDGLLEKTLEP